MDNKKRRYTRVASYGLVVEEDRILLCRISPKVKNHGGYWTLPGGGIDFGEAPMDAMVREVEEETGLIVRSTGVLDIDSCLLTDDTGNEFHGIRIIYNTELLGGELRNEVDGSTDECAWFTLVEIKNLSLVDLAKVGVELAVLAR